MAIKAKAAKAATRPAAQKNSVPLTVFTLSAPEAREVFVAGDFNGWRADELKARKLKGGIWRKSIALKPGNYQYLFVVDGQWWTDPENPVRVRNPYGTENSIVAVG